MFVRSGFGLVVAGVEFAGWLLGETGGGDGGWDDGHV